MIVLHFSKTVLPGIMALGSLNLDRLVHRLLHLEAPKAC